MGGGSDEAVIVESIVFNLFNLYMFLTKFITKFNCVCVV